MGDRDIPSAAVLAQQLTPGLVRGAVRPTDRPPRLVGAGGDLLRAQRLILQPGSGYSAHNAL